MYIQSGKGCFKVAGWNISKKGELFVEKMSGASVMITDNPEKASFIFDELNKKAQLEAVTLMAYPDALFANTDMVSLDESGNVIDEEGNAIDKFGNVIEVNAEVAKEVFVNLLPHQLKDTEIAKREKQEKAKQDQMKEVKKKVKDLELVDPENL